MKLPPSVSRILKKDPNLNPTSKTAYMFLFKVLPYTFLVRTLFLIWKGGQNVKWQTERRLYGNSEIEVSKAMKRNWSWLTKLGTERLWERLMEMSNFKEGVINFGPNFSTQTSSAESHRNDFFIKINHIRFAALVVKIKDEWL